MYELASIEFKGEVHPKNLLISDVRSDEIGKNAVVTSGSQYIFIQSSKTCDMEAAILICK